MVYPSKSNPDYLSESTSLAALEIDNHLLNRNNNFNNVIEFRRILKQYQQEQTISEYVGPTVHQFPFQKVLDSQLTRLKTIDDLEKEISIFAKKLNYVPNLPKQELEELRKTFIGLSRHYMALTTTPNPY